MTEEFQKVLRHDDFAYSSELCTNKPWVDTFVTTLGHFENSRYRSRGTKELLTGIIFFHFIEFNSATGNCQKYSPTSKKKGRDRDACQDYTSIHTSLHYIHVILTLAILYLSGAAVGHCVVL